MSLEVVNHTHSEAPVDVRDTLLKALEAHEANYSLRRGMDYHSNALWYGMELGGSVYFVSTGRRSFLAGGLPHGLVVESGTLQGTPMSGHGIRSYLDGETVEADKLLSELERFFAAHAMFQHAAMPAILALWIAAGYLHMAFHSFPYLWITSPQKGCGKTRVLELLAAVAFRANQIQVSPTQAVLYRSLHATAEVLILDEFEKATDDTKQAVVTVLNAGFNRGSKVSRCTGKDYGLESFDVYGPKAFAGLNSLPDTLASRTIEIAMLPKTQADNIQPFIQATMGDQLQRWRDALAIWALENAPMAAELAASPGLLGVPANLDDRATDYMTPLFAVAKVAGWGDEALREFCESLAEVRGDRASEGDTSKAIAVLQTWLGQRDQARLSLEEAARLFTSAGLFAFSGSRSAGNLLRKLGVRVKQFRLDGSKTGKGVSILRSQIEELAKRFPPAPEAVEGLQLVA